MGLFANPFDAATYRWVAPTLAQAGDAVAHVAVDVSPIGGLYALGGVVNAATGGKTKTLDAYAALTRGAAVGTRYSTLTQAASGYQGPMPNQGKWAAPVLNKATVRVAAQTVQTAASVVHDVGNAGLKGLGLPTLGTLALIAGGGALGLGAVYVATR